jgi:hypothetical protein
VTATTPNKPKRPKGRPRKSIVENGVDDSVDADADADAESALPAESPSGRSYWLMKAEPDSRLEKGVDVKFSIDDLHAATEPEPWNGRASNHTSPFQEKRVRG